MSGTFGKYLLPSLLASGAAFTALSLPLVVYGNERVDFQLSETVGVSATVQELAAPYLGLSGLASVAIGGGTMTAIAIRRARKNALATEQSILSEKESLEIRERSLQEALMSDSGLMKSGLGFFLDDTATTPQATPSFPVPTLAEAIVAVEPPAVATTSVATVAAVSTAPAVVNVPLPQTQPAFVLSDPTPTPSFMVNASGAGIQPVKVPRVTVQSATSPLHAAHGFLGFVRSTQAVPSAALAWVEESEVAYSTTQQIEVLQTQLQGLMVQIEHLQSSLKTQPIAQSPYRIEVIENDAALLASPVSHRFQPFEHSWATAARLAS